MNRKKTIIFGLSVFSLLGTVALAGSGSAEIRSFMSVSDFSVVSSNVDFRFAELVGPSDSNTATHMLIDGLVAVSDGSSVVTSNYRAVDIADGSVQDVGRIYLTLPAQSASAGVSSPIVGIVARTGGWDGYTTTSASASTIGDSAGSISYDADSDSISFSLVRGSQTFTGSTTYTVIDDMTLKLDALTLSDGSSSYDFYSSVLNYSGADFYGVLDSMDLAASYDSLMFSIGLSGLPDLDQDSIPDITDPSIQSSTGVELVVGEWRENAANLGWLKGLTTDWGSSFVYGYVYVPRFPWVYIYGYGWGYFGGRVGTNVWLYNTSDGWIVANDDHTGWYQYQTSPGVWLWGNFITQARGQ